MRYRVTFNSALGGKKERIIDIDYIKEEGSYTDFYKNDKIVLSVPTPKADLIELLPESQPAASDAGNVVMFPGRAQ